MFPTHPYVLLESPDQRRRLSEDPRGFLAAHPDGAILDEVQRVPELLLDIYKERLTTISVQVVSS